MPSATEESAPSFHLAPISSSLAGGHLLISWRSAFEALDQSRSLSQEAPLSIQSFLTDDRSILQLSQRFQPFPNPTASSRSEFETRTASINITPSENGRYNIQDIKNDVAWLAEQVSIDEVSGLRLVLLEWQSRPSAHLLTGYAEEERISLRSAIGSDVSFPELTEPKAFHSTASRRARLLDLYFEERLYIIQCYVVVMSTTWLDSPTAPAERKYPPFTAPTDAWNKWMSDVDDRASKIKQADRMVEVAIDAIRTRLASLDTAPSWTVADAQSDAYLQGQNFAFTLREINALLQLILVALSSVAQPLPAAPVQAWFDLAESVNFFASLQVNVPSIQPIATSIATLTSLVSLLILRMPFALDEIDSETTTSQASQYYFQSADCLQTVLRALQQGIITATALVGPALFSLVVLLGHLRSQVTSPDDYEDEELSPVQTRFSDSALATQQLLEDVLANVDLGGADEDPVAHLANQAIGPCSLHAVLQSLAAEAAEQFSQAVDLKALLHVRVALLELARACVVILQYDDEIIQSVVAILGHDSTSVPLGMSQEVLVKAFLVDIVLADDVVFQPKLLDIARRRFPFEHGPYLTLLENINRVRPPINGAPFSEIFGSSPTFTQQLPEGFRGFMNYREDELLNYIQLTEDLDLYGSRKVGSFRDSTRLLAMRATSSNDDFRTLPAGTVGRIVSSNKPQVVEWSYHYSLWTYLGAALSTVPSNSDKVDLITPSPGIRAVAAEILNLFSTQLSNPGALQDYTVHKEAAEEALGEASNSLPNDQDILSVVSDIFEEELSSFSSQRADQTTELLAGCVRFLAVGVPFQPSRIWPILGRSQLLDIEGRGGKLMSVASSLEIALGRYDFLLATADLFRALVDDTLANCFGPEAESMAMSRFQDKATPRDSGSRPPVKYTSKLLLAFTRAYHDVMLSCNEWTFDAPGQKLDLMSKITSIFDDIVHCVYGYDDTREPSKKATRALAPAAAFLTEAFLSKSASHLAVNSLLDSCYTGLTSAARTSYDSPVVSMLLRVLGFVTTLFEVSAAESLPATFLQSQFFRGLPFLIRLYAFTPPLRQSLLKTLQSLLKKVGLQDQEPPSLYGHLGAEVSKAFLTLVSDHQRAAEDTELSSEIWTFLTTVIAQRQQWFATYILTGRDPKEQSKKPSDTNPHCHSALDQALAQLSKMELEQSAQPLPILKFIRLSQNLWPWVTDCIRRQSTFLHRITDYVEVLGRQVRPDSKESELQLACKHASVGLVAEILAMYLHNARQLGDTSIVQKIATKLAFFEKEGVLQPGYNEQLHRRLRDNFKILLPGCDLSSFKRRFGQREIDVDYFYDTSFGSRLLGSRKSWRQGGKGLINDVGRVNTNLSLVEAQIQAIKGWRALAVELSRDLPQNRETAEPLTLLVKQCLRLCNTADLSHNIFESLVATTADLALTILQRLVTITHDSAIMRSLLVEAWNLVQRISTSTDFAGDGDRLHRASLRTLFLTIQPWTWEARLNEQSATAGTEKARVAELGSSFLSIVSDVVCGGFISLSQQLHETRHLVQPSDFTILTAILQSILMVRGIEPQHTLIALRIQESGVSRYATALFSWANRFSSPVSLADSSDPSSVDGVHDPIYAELSIQFLLECSNLQPTTEFLATDMVLSQLANAPLMQYYRRKGGFAQFDEPQRMFPIWSRGVLPLCLNLLMTVGEPYALEVANFLNSFPEQLSRASESLDEKIKPTAGNPTAGCITLNMASEVQSLALIAVMLDRMRDSPSAQVIGEIPELSWNRAIVKEDLEVWVTGSREALAQRVTPTNEGEVILARKKDGDVNALVEKVAGELSAALRILNGA